MKVTVHLNHYLHPQAFLNPLHPTDLICITPSFRHPCHLYRCYLAEFLCVYTFSCSLHSWSSGAAFSFVCSVRFSLFIQTYILSILTIYIKSGYTPFIIFVEFLLKMSFRWALITVGSEILLVLFPITVFLPFFFAFISTR
jgi:hypothetical protein